MVVKKSMYIVAVEKHLTEKVSGILVITFIVIFDVDNSSSCHTDNRQNDFLVLDEGDTFGINGSFGALGKKFSISIRKRKTKFYVSLH